MTDPWPHAQPPYFERVGIEFDTAINVATGGPLGWTVSERAAYGAGWRPSNDPAVAVRTGTKQRGWCWFCAALSIIVQPGHCRVQFTNLETPGFDMVRASVAFAAGFATIAAVADLIVRLF